MPTNGSWPGGGEEPITSVANPTIRFARSLHRRRVRERERATIVEGLRAIETAVALGVRMRALIVDARRIKQLPADTLVPLYQAAERVIFADDAPFQSVADTDHPQPLIAVCDIPSIAVRSPTTLILALDAIRDPGNLGTLLRSAAAVGVDGVVLLPGCVDPFSPKVVRASAGLVFGMPVTHVADFSSWLATTFESRPTVALAEAGATLAYDRHDWTAPTVLVLGGEAHGASEKARTFADCIVGIPMDSRVESLNAAVAGGVLLFEAARQRRLKA